MVSVASRLLVALFAAGLALAQDKEPPVDPGLPDRLKQLKSMIKDRKMREDFRAIGLIQELVKTPDNINEKDRSKIAKALGEVFLVGKVRAPGQDHVYREAGDALSKLETDGAKYLAKALASNRPLSLSRWSPACRARSLRPRPPAARSPGSSAVARA